MRDRSPGNRDGAGRREGRGPRDRGTGDFRGGSPGGQRGRGQRDFRGQADRGPREGGRRFDRQQPGGEGPMRRGRPPRAERPNWDDPPAAVEVDEASFELDDAI